MGPTERKVEEELARDVGDGKKAIPGRGNYVCKGLGAGEWDVQAPFSHT